MQYNDASHPGWRGGLGHGNASTVLLRRQSLRCLRAPTTLPQTLFKMRGARTKKEKTRSKALFSSFARFRSTVVGGWGVRQRVTPLQVRCKMVDSSAGNHGYCECSGPLWAAMPLCGLYFFSCADRPRRMLLRPLPYLAATYVPFHCQYTAKPLSVLCGLPSLCRNMVLPKILVSLGFQNVTWTHARHGGAVVQPGRPAKTDNWGRGAML